MAYDFTVTSDVGQKDGCILFCGDFTLDKEQHCWEASVSAGRLKKVTERGSLKPVEFQLVTANDRTPLQQGKKLRVALRKLAGPVIAAHWNHPSTFCARAGTCDGLIFTNRTVTEGIGELRGRAAQEVQSAREAFHRQLQSING